MAATDKDYKNKILISKVDKDGSIDEFRRNDFNDIFKSFSNVLKKIKNTEEDIEIFKKMFYDDSNYNSIIDSCAYLIDYNCFYEMTTVYGEVYVEIVSNIDFSDLYDELKSEFSDEYNIQILSYYYYYQKKEAFNVSYLLDQKGELEQINETLNDELTTVKDELSSLKEDFKNILIDIVLNDSISENLATKLISSIDSEILKSSLIKKDTSDISTDFIESYIGERKFLISKDLEAS